MKEKRLLLLLCAALFCYLPITVVAQTKITVTGTVKDEDGFPLQGVTVKMRYLPLQAITDNNGKYKIVTIDTAQLVFTYVGKKTITERVSSRRVIDVVLDPAESAMDDVIIIGYNTTRRKDLTASVSTVSKDALSNRTILSVPDALRGQAAGVQITQNDGAPGSEYTFRIRGASSISASSTPLFVVDGVLRDDINDISPGDIENIEILKDASGTAMYGARGANGVVIITTKTGKLGKTAVELYANTSLQKVARLFPVMSSQQYARGRLLASAYDFSAPSADDPNVPATVKPGYTYYRDSPLGTPGAFWGVNTNSEYYDWQSYGSPDSIHTNWQDAMFQNALVQEYRINISGGSKDTKYSLMGGYLNQEGLIVFSNYKRYNGRFNFEQKLSQIFKMTLNLAGGYSFTDGYKAGSLNGGVVSNGIITAMLNKPPTDPLTYNDVEDNEDVDGYETLNPYSIGKYITNHKYSTDWLARLAFDVKLSKAFTYRITGTYSNNNPNTDAYYPKFTGSGSKYNGRAYLTRGIVKNFMNEHLLYFQKRFNRNHQLNVVGGATFELNKNNLVSAENQNYDIETLGVYGLSNGKVPIIPTYDITQWTMASFLTRAEYNYKDKYLVTGTFRADGSSRFSAHNKWGYFPSAGIGWRVSEEPFMKNVRALSNLKFRATVGQSGNTAIPSYLTLSTIGTYFSPMDGYTPDYGVVVERPENLSLKWETTTQFNGGIDLGLFNDRVSITGEYYLKRTKDLLIQKVTPGYSGYRRSWTNLGEIENSGLEFTVAAALLRKKNFNWTLNANIGFNRSKAIEVGPELLIDPGVISGMGNSVIIRNGEPIGQWYGYQTDGIYQSYDEIINSGLTQINGTAIAAVTPGSRKFIDQNGDHIIDAADRVVLGKGQPDFTGGITNFFSYKDFSLNVIIQYSYGNQIFNANRVVLERGQGSTNMTTVLADGWRPSLYDMTTGALIEPGNPSNQYRIPGNREVVQIMMSDWVEDGSYIRLSDVTLTYNLSRKKLNNFLGVSGISIFASGRNLWISTKYMGYDPEVNTRQGGFGDLMPSLDYASYPRTRMYALGVNVKF